MRAFFLIGFVLAMFMSAAQGAPASFTTTHVWNDESAYFTFPSGESESFFADPMLALKVESVYADGVALTAMPQKGTVPWHIRTNVFRPVLPTRMIYRLSTRQFYSVASQTTSGVLNVVTYEIPLDSKKIEISYRVRYPNGKISPEMTLTSISSYDFREVDDK